MKAKIIPFVLASFFLSLGHVPAQQPPTLLWSYNTPYTVTGCPAISPDGTIYLGTAGALYAITNAGSNKWSYTVTMNGSPAIGADGTIYLLQSSSGNFSGQLYALNPAGSQKWTFPAHGANGSPAVGLDGTIYVEGYPNLYAVTPSGTMKWEYVTADQMASSPIIGGDGTIYLGSHDGGSFYAFNQDGTVKWRFTLSTSPGDSAAIGADGSIYVTGGPLYVFNADGTNLWRSTNGNFTGSSPAIGKDGTIYVAGNNNSSLNALKPTGGNYWSGIPGFTGFGYPSTTPAIDASGMLYYTGSNSLYAVTPQGNVQWIFGSPYALQRPPPPTGVSPAIGPDGTIYAAFTTTLYAIAGTNALGNTPWPMYRQNLRHTGKVEKPSLNQPKKRADATFEFEMFGEVGQPYTIQSSTNLASWAVLTNFIASTQTTSVVDFTASNSPSRFYRALIQ